MAGRRHRERPGGDIGCCRGRSVLQGVVTGVGAADADAADAHRLAGAGVLAAEGRPRVTDRQRIAANAVVAENNISVRHAVVYFVDTGRRHRQAAGRNVRCRGSRGVAQSVVAGVAAADADTADVYRLSGTDVFVAKTGRAADRQGVARQPVVAIGNAGGCTSVIGLVLAGHRHRDRPGGDISCCRGGGVAQSVVTGVVTANAKAADAYRFPCPDVLVAKTGRAADRQGIAANAVVAESNISVRRAVVYFIDTGRRHRDRPDGDIGCCCGGGVAQSVVAGVGAADADVADVHRFPCPDVLVAKTGRAADRQGIARHPVAAVGDTGGCIAIVDLALAGHRHRDRPGGDVGRRRGGADGVVAGGRAGEGGGVNRHRLAGADFFVIEGAAGQRHGVTADHTPEGAVHARRGRAVVDLAARRQAVDGQRFFVDGQRAAHEGDVVALLAGGVQAAGRDGVCAGVHRSLRRTAVGESALDAAGLAAGGEASPVVAAVCVAVVRLDDVVGGDGQRGEEGFEEGTGLAVVYAPFGGEVEANEIALILHLVAGEAGSVAPGGGLPGGLDVPIGIIATHVGDAAHQAAGVAEAADRAGAVGLVDLTGAEILADEAAAGAAGAAGHGDAAGAVGVPDAKVVAGAEKAAGAADGITVVRDGDTAGVIGATDGPVTGHADAIAHDAAGVAFVAAAGRDAAGVVAVSNSGAIGVTDEAAGVSGAGDGTGDMVAVSNRAQVVPADEAAGVEGAIDTAGAIGAGNGSTIVVSDQAADFGGLAGAGYITGGIRVHDVAGGGIVTYQAADHIVTAAGDGGAVV